MSKIVLLKNMFTLWCVKLLNTTIPIVKDSRFKAHLITDWDNKVVKYNPYYVRHWGEAEIMAGIFHEIRHIIQGEIPYDTKESMILCERDAEEYCIKMIKRYYPLHLKELISYSKKQLKNRIWRKNFPIHYKAFKDIKEYQ